MKQATLNLNLNVKKSRKEVFLEQMEQVVPWADLVELIAPYYPEGKTGRPPFSLQTMLRTHFMQQWFTLSDPGMEEAFFDTPLYREFAQLEEYARLPDESAILRFRHRLEKHKLSEQILKVVNVLLTQCSADPARLAIENRHRGRCHLDSSTHLYQEPRQGS
jgi:IS5 family transposase